MVEQGLAAWPRGLLLLDLAEGVGVCICDASVGIGATVASGGGAATTMSHRKVEVVTFGWQGEEDEVSGRHGSKGEKNICFVGVCGLTDSNGDKGAFARRAGIDSGHGLSLWWDGLEKRWEGNAITHRTVLKVGDWGFRSPKGPSVLALPVREKYNPIDLTFPLRKNGFSYSQVVLSQVLHRRTALRIMHL